MPKLKSAEILNTAKKFYLNGDYESAKSTILEGKSQLDPGLFHYNLGSIFLKMGKLGPARYNLEKAKQEGFSYPMLWKNLDFVKAQSQVMDPTKARTTQEVFLGKTLDLSTSLVAIFSLLVTITLLFLVRRKQIRIAYAVGVFLMMAFLPLAGKIYINESYNYAIALETARVYEGPSKIYPDYGELGEGSRVIVNRFHDNWYFIVSPKELSGWIERNQLGFY